MPNTSASAPTQDVPEVLYGVDTGIATITLNRPERLNALTPSMQRRYLAALQEADQDAAVKVIVVTGAGRGFCAGADLDCLETANPDTVAERQVTAPVPGDYAMELSKPLIAAVNGAAAGMGFAHALFADLRFASDEAFFTTSFSRLGLTGEAGFTWLLERLVGTANALDLLYTSRRVTAREALRLGLVQRVVASDRLLETVYQYAEQIATEASMYSVSVLRKQVYNSWSQDWTTAHAESNEYLVDQFKHPGFADRIASRRRSVPKHAL